jgi:SAM-dependent methyltransferase
MSDPSPVYDWLKRSLGQHLLALETAAAAGYLDQVFGVQAIQVGLWGSKDQFRASARTTRYAVMTGDPDADADFIGPAGELALNSDSIDAVILPHTLETEADPHQVLREVERVLMGEGHLLILGFNPNSLWGIRHQFSGGKFPPGIRRFISEYRLRDWLKLLGFEVLSVSGYCAGPPASRPAWLRESRVNGPIGNGPLQLMAGAYCLLACKRVFSGMLIRPELKRTPRVLAGLAEPSTRNST